MRDQKAANCKRHPLAVICDSGLEENVLEGGRLDHTVGEPRGVAVKHARQRHRAGRRPSLRQPARTWWGSALSFGHGVGFRTTSPTNPAPAAATPRDTIPRSTLVAAGSASLERARPRAGPWEQARPGLERGKAGSLGLSDRNVTCERGGDWAEDGQRGQGNHGTANVRTRRRPRSEEGLGSWGVLSLPVSRAS